MVDFQIPVNPEYTWDLTPEEQADYVNPVELNNKLIEFQNQHARVASKITADQRKRAELKVSLRDADNKLTRFRNKLLRLHPPPNNDRKTNILLESYVERLALDEGVEGQWEQVNFAVRTLESQIELLEADIESGKSITFMLRDFYENIKTHLAFRKHEWRQTVGALGP